jgi:predicted RNA polymerase sigma factor
VVLHVLYLIFNEGYASTSGPSLQRVELSADAIRLARVVHRLQRRLWLGESGAAAATQSRRRRRRGGLYAVRAHLLEMAGDRAGARDWYEAAARRATSLPLQRYLHGRAARLA